MYYVNVTTQSNHKIANQFKVVDPDDDMGKACIKCAIERLQHGMPALETAVKLDKTIQPILEEYKTTFLSLVDYVIKNKEKLKNYD